jgi:RNA polymerase sigma-70 factor (ECF subfamily)
MDDINLARRVVAGDEAASERFFAEYFPRLYRFASSRLRGDEQAAEEVVQATLIRAVRKLPTYRGDAPLFTWLCTLCRREISAWLQRTGRVAEVSLTEDREETGDDPELQARRGELSRLVRATLDRLPRRYGQVLEWKYIHELSVDEIAHRLGVGYKAAESLLTRARHAFHETFAGGL